MPRRGGTIARGYDHIHTAMREHFKPLVLAGQAVCSRCNELIDPSEPWDLGHVEGSRTRWSGPEHRLCNRRAGAANMNAQRRRRRSRIW